MPATKTKAETARFIAQGTGLQIRIEHVTEERDSGGHKQMKTPGKVAKFMPDYMGNQFYESSDPDEIAILREKAASNDPKFTEVPIPKPDSAPVLKQIVGLTARGDKAALIALAREEETTWERDDVMEALADALEALG